MVALDTSSYRRSDLLLPSPPSVSAIPPRRATVSVSSSAPSFTFTNTFESHRPHSRSERYGPFDPRYPYRRSTISGHSQGHNVNDAPQLVRISRRIPTKPNNTSPANALPSSRLPAPTTR